MRGEWTIWFGLMSRNPNFYAGRAWGSALGCWTWGAAILLMSGVYAIAADRATLIVAKSSCPAATRAANPKEYPPNFAATVAQQINAPWRESYGAFLDRRIEESAAPVLTAFTGLRRMKGAANID
jgi:hypothetical protein